MATLFYTQPKPQPIQKLALSPLFFPSCFVATGCLMSLQGSVWLLKPWKNLGTNQAFEGLCTSSGVQMDPKLCQKKTPHSCCTVIFTTCVAAHNVQTLWENSETDRAERLCSSRLAGFVELLHVLTVLNLLTGNDTILSDNSFRFFLLFERKERTICFHLVSSCCIDVRPCYSK